MICTISALGVRKNHAGQRRVCAPCRLRPLGAALAAFALGALPALAQNHSAERGDAVVLHSDIPELIETGLGPLDMPFAWLLLGFLIVGAVVLVIRFVTTIIIRSDNRRKQKFKLLARQLLTVMASLIDYKSEYKTGHSFRVAEYAKMIGQRMRLQETEVETLHLAAALHDIGKTRLPGEILDHKGPLGEEELATVRRHTLDAVELLRPITALEGVIEAVQFHHERMDGSGYPNGLKGDEIPLSARIICICNAFDSMLCDRSYHAAVSVETALSELVRNAGTQFDENITAIMISLIEEGAVPL